MEEEPPERGTSEGSTAEEPQPAREDEQPRPGKAFGADSADDAEGVQDAEAADSTDNKGYIDNTGNTGDTANTSDVDDAADGKGYERAEQLDDGESRPYDAEGEQDDAEDHNAEGENREQDEHDQPKRDADAGTRPDEPDNSGSTTDDAAPSEPVAARVPWWKPTPSRLIAAVGFAAAGLLFVTSGLDARGTDLRAERQTDLTGLITSESQRNKELERDVSQLRDSVDDLSGQVGGASAAKSQRRISKLQPEVGLTPVNGPALRVTLDDAPPEANPAEADPDALIVHQQDIQAVVNAMRAGGAEAVSIQGQRIVATSAIRCVGNSVVLHGVPYPPPYKIEAIGNVSDMTQALNESKGVRVYRQYVDRFRLGYSVERLNRTRIPGYDGSLELGYAKAKRDPNASR